MEGRTSRTKIKKSLGPDFESYPFHKKSRRESTGSKEDVKPPTPALMPQDAPICDYCLLSAVCNRRGKPEDLLICKDCRAKAHPSCMEYSEELAKRARTSPWQCIDCKTCYICEDSGDPDAMLFCDACDKGYHMSCHTPPIREKPTGKWECSKCMTELDFEERDMETESTSRSDHYHRREGRGHIGLPTPSDSPVQFLDESDRKQSTAKLNGTMPAPIPKLANTMKLEVPDASDWTIEDVVGFFHEMGFPDQADVFREQEIDGKSLLLMKRSDVLTGLALKLGPALKIYAHVQRLQTGGQIVH